MSDETPNSPEKVVDPSLQPEVSALDTDVVESDHVPTTDDSDQAAAAKTSGTVVRKTSRAPVKKTAPTPKRSEKRTGPSDEGKRVGPVTFTKQSVGELKLVKWPTFDQLGQYFAAVLIFVLFIIAFVGLLDLGFGAGLLALFG